MQRNVELEKLVAIWLIKLCRAQGREPDALDQEVYADAFTEHGCGDLEILDKAFREIVRKDEFRPSPARVLVVYARLAGEKFLANGKSRIEDPISPEELRTAKKEYAKLRDDLTPVARMPR